ncbi:MAG: hypothetical protein AMXMBFR16_12140 [Candidatus Uhrbacteria bacterium]
MRFGVSRSRVEGAKRWALPRKPDSIDQQYDSELSGLRSLDPNVFDVVTLTPDGAYVIMHMSKSGLLRESGSYERFAKEGRWGAVWQGRPGGIPYLANVSQLANQLASQRLASSPKLVSGGISIVKGRIDQLGDDGGELRITSDSGEEISVTVPENASVAVYGVLSDDRLRVGDEIAVRRIRKQGSARLSDISRVFLFGERDSLKHGVFPVGSPTKRKGASIVEVIQGAIQQIAKNVIRIKVGSRSVSIRAKKLDVLVSSRDFGLARPGDSIWIGGRVAESGAIVAQEVRISMRR